MNVFTGLFPNVPSSKSFFFSLARWSMSGLWHNGISEYQALDKIVFLHVFVFLIHRFRKESSCRSKICPSKFQLYKSKEECPAASKATFPASFSVSGPAAISTHPSGLVGADSIGVISISTVGGRMDWTVI